MCRSLIFSEVKPVRKGFGYESDIDNQDFPDPKPDYSDDDFEVNYAKTSQRKKTLKGMYDQLMSKGAVAENPEQLVNF